MCRDGSLIMTLRKTAVAACGEEKQVKAAHEVVGEIRKSSHPLLETNVIREIKIQEGEV